VGGSLAEGLVSWGGHQPADVELGGRHGLDLINEREENANENERMSDAAEN
jgi:hypothetical protein